MLCTPGLFCSHCWPPLNGAWDPIHFTSQAGHFGFITQLPSQSNADLGDLKMGVSLILSLETGFDFKEFYLLTVSRLLRWWPFSPLTWAPGHHAQWTHFFWVWDPDSELVQQVCCWCWLLVLQNLVPLLHVRCDAFISSFILPPLFHWHSSWAFL